MWPGGEWDVLIICSCFFPLTSTSTSLDPMKPSETLTSILSCLSLSFCFSSSLSLLVFKNRIDMTCALVLAVVYILVTILIFALGVARAPSECEMSGQDKALCEQTQATILRHGRDSGYGGIHHPHNG